MNAPCQIHSRLRRGYRLQFKLIPQTFSRLSTSALLTENSSFSFPSIQMLRSCGSAFTRAGMSIFSNKHKALGIQADTRNNSLDSSQFTTERSTSVLWLLSAHDDQDNDRRPSCCAFYSALYSVGRPGGTFTQNLGVVPVPWRQCRCIPNKSPLRKMILHKPSPPKHPHVPRPTTPLTSHSSFN
jgi:hypothetical protein